MKKLLSLMFLLVSFQAFAQQADSKYKCIAADGYFPETFASGYLEFTYVESSDEFIVNQESSNFSLYEDFQMGSVGAINIDGLEYIHQEDVSEFLLYVDVTVKDLTINGKTTSVSSARLEALCEVE